MYYLQFKYYNIYLLSLIINFTISIVSLLHTLLYLLSLYFILFYLLQRSPRRLTLPTPNPDNYLLYLDPHMTQNVIPGSTSGSTGREDVDGCDWSDPAAAAEEDCPPSRSDDSTYHCNHVSHMNISDMDPSLAVVSF